MSTSRELKEVKGRAAAVKGEQKRTQLTLKEVEDIAPDTRLFRSLGEIQPHHIVCESVAAVGLWTDGRRGWLAGRAGKMFLLSEKPTVVKNLKSRLEDQEQKEKDLDVSGGGQGHHLL